MSATSATVLCHRGPSALRRALLVVFTLVGTGCGDGESKAGRARFQPLGEIEKFALVVGIGDYPRQDDKLFSPSKDATRFAELLVSTYGFKKTNVTTLLDRAATRPAILAASRFEQADSNDLVVVFFSGHGVRLDKNYSIVDAEKSSRDQALLVWDSSGKSTIILDDEIGYLLSSLRTNNVLLLADACFSGTIMHVTEIQRSVWAASFRMFQRSEPSNRPVFLTKSTLIGNVSQFVLPGAFVSDGQEPPPEQPSGDLADVRDEVVLLAASEESSRAYAGVNWPAVGDHRSVFSYYLMKRLKETPDQATFETLIEGIRQDALSGVPCLENNACQRPQIVGRSNVRIEQLLGKKKPLA